MKNVLILTVCTVLFSCSSEPNKDESVKNDPLPYSDSISENEIANTSDADSSPEEIGPEFDFRDSKYIVVANNLRGRDKPSTSGKPTYSYPIGSLLKSIEITKERDILNLGDASGGSCDEYGYFWHQVEDFNGNKGWGYGQFLFEVKWDPSAKPFLINGRTFYLGSAYRTSYGPSDADGLTGCDELELMFFYNKTSKTGYPIYANDKLNTEGANHFLAGYDSDLLLRMSGEGGGSDLLKTKLLDNGDFRMNFMNGYQEGSNESELTISFENEKFMVKSHSDTERDY